MGGEPPSSTELSSRLSAGAEASLSELLALWAMRGNNADWLDEPRTYTTLAERILQLGEPLFAHDVCLAGLERHPGHSRLRQLFGLALARSGCTHRANEILSGLKSEGRNDAQTLGLLGRTWKDLWVEAPNSPERRNLLIEAAKCYADAYANSEAEGTDTRSWVGINAAATTALLGDKERAEQLAIEVSNACRAELIALDVNDQ